MTDLGYSPADIGLLTGLAMGIKLLGPLVWGRMADRGGEKRSIILATSLGAWLAVGLFFMDHGLVYLITVAVIFHFFHIGAIALMEVTTMEGVERHGWDYGRIRLWGSWGFIVLAVGLGPWTDRWGLGWVPRFLLLFVGLQTLTAWWLPRQSSQAVTTTAPLPALFRRREVRWFYLTALLMQISHGAYYGFMSIHLENHGYSRTAIGALWSLGVLAEIFVLARSNVILARFGVSFVIIFSVFLAACRWSLFSLTVVWPLVVFGQILHAFTFGTFHVASVRRIFEMAPPSRRAMAQSWYSAISYGIGMAMGLWISGQFFESLGAFSLFGLMAVIALMGTWAAMRHAHLMKQSS